MFAVVKYQLILKCAVSLSLSLYNVPPEFKTNSFGGNMSKLFVHIFMKFDIVLRNKRGTLHHLQSFYGSYYVICRHLFIVCIIMPKYVMAFGVCTV